MIMTTYLVGFRMYPADCWWVFDGGIKWMKMGRATGCLSQRRQVGTNQL